MLNNILILGPKCSGKTTFIYTLLKIKNKVSITIGTELYAYKDLNKNKNKIFLWEVGNGIHYSEIINSLLVRFNTIMIIDNNKNVDFINKIIVLIKDYSNIKNIIIIFNFEDEINDFKNNYEEYIKSLNKKIKFYIFSINCNKYNEVINIIKFIENNIII